MKQIEVITRYGLRIRKSPEIIKGNIMGVLPPGTTKKVYNEVKAGGYTWGNVSHNALLGWIALGAGLVIDLDNTVEFRWVSWPTEYIFYPGTHTPAVNQKFGANKDTYEKYGLPGHEGIDFYAPTGSKIFAVAPGKVTRVGDDREKKSKGGHNYGVRVYIDHNDGYQTIYAHLDRRLVDVGHTISGGQLIGYADDTGNSYGSHLHLTMKNEKGLDNWPYKIIDPTPFFVDLLRG